MVHIELYWIIYFGAHHCIGLHWIDAEDLRAISVMTSHISAWQYASTVKSQIKIES